MRRVMLLAVLTACTRTTDLQDAFIDCTSVTVTPGGSTTTTYDNKGWPVREEFEAGGVSQTVLETEYERIAGDVRTAVRTRDGDDFQIVTYDAHEHVERVEREGQEPIECANTHIEDEILVRSECDEVITTFDECGHVAGVEDGTRVEQVFVTADADCSPLALEAQGVDAQGDFFRSVAYAFGRPVGQTEVREGEVVGSVTVWSCPEQ